MSEKIYRAGFENIVNVDVSKRLLDNLRSRLGSSMPHMSWEFANASSLSFDDAAFDVTLDKGTFDALEANMVLLQLAMKEAHRTLRPGGVLLSVTFNDVAKRVEAQLQQAADWGTCRTRVWQKEAQGAGSGEDKTSRYYLHACQR